MTQTIIEQLKEFIEIAESKYSHNSWIQDDKIKVYLRKGRHVVHPHILATTLDIGAVEVDEKFQKQGIWTNFLNQAITLNPWEGVYIECVHNLDLAASLFKRGWFQVAQSITSAPESFYMPKNHRDYFDKVNNPKLAPPKISLRF